MTTIAYDGKTVACDGRESGGGIIFTDSVEKWRSTDEGVFFGAGIPCDIEKLVQISSLEVFDVAYEADLILIDNDRNAWVITQSEHGSVYKNRLNHLDSYAIGSGMPFALAAMDMGMTAKEAVEYAKTRDSHTGGKVSVFDIETMSFSDGR